VIGFWASGGTHTSVRSKECENLISNNKVWQISAVVFTGCFAIVCQCDHFHSKLTGHVLFLLLLGVSKHSLVVMRISSFIFSYAYDFFLFIKVIFLSLFTASNLYEFLSSAEHKRSYFEECCNQDPIDLHSRKNISILLHSSKHLQQKKEIHTGLKQLKGE